MCLIMTTGPERYSDLGTIRDIKIQQLNSVFNHSWLSNNLLRQLVEVKFCVKLHIMSPPNLSENGFQLKKLTNSKNIIK
jgi:hypothetical protein